MISRGCTCAAAPDLLVFGTAALRAHPALGCRNRPAPSPAAVISPRQGAIVRGAFLGCAVQYFPDLREVLAWRTGDVEEEEDDDYEERKSECVPFVLFNGITW